MLEIILVLGQRNEGGAPFVCLAAYHHTLKRVGTQIQTSQLVTLF